MFYCIYCFVVFIVFIVFVVYFFVLPLIILYNNISNENVRNKQLRIIIQAHLIEQ